jgi:mannonate dehydratase
MHPDDPPWRIFGLPRIICTGPDLERLISLVDSTSNGVTFCTGSLGSRPDNDLPAMIRRLGSLLGEGRIHFAHCRNVVITGERAFHETPTRQRSGALTCARCSARSAIPTLRVRCAPITAE